MSRLCRPAGVGIDSPVPSGVRLDCGLFVCLFVITKPENRYFASAKVCSVLEKLSVQLASAADGGSIFDCEDRDLLCAYCRKTLAAAGVVMCQTCLAQRYYSGQCKQKHWAVAHKYICSMLPSATAHV